MYEIEANPITDRLRQLTDAFFERKKISVGANGIVYIDGKRDKENALERLYMLAMLPHQAPGINDKSKLMFFEEKVASLKREAFARIVDSISYKPEKEKEGQRQLALWLEATLGYKPTDLDIAVLNHTLWQICRKAHGLRTEFELMPIFISTAQGIGKSENIRHLLKPIKEVLIDGQSVDYITDKNNYAELGNNLCLFADEMSRCNHTDIQKLKAVITGESLSYRKFFKQSNAHAVQQCTFIGTSNREFRDMIQDTTGARRFYTYNCKPSESRDALQARFDLVNSLDPYTIWQSVNETNDVRYTKPYAAQLEAAQEQLRLPTSIEEWLDEIGQTPGSVPVQLAEMYKAYKAYVLDSGRKEMYSKRNFKLTLKDRGFLVSTYGNGSIVVHCNKKSLKEGLSIESPSSKKIEEITNVKAN